MSEVRPLSDVLGSASDWQVESGSGAGRSRCPECGEVFEYPNQALADAVLVDHLARRPTCALGAQNGLH